MIERDNEDIYRNQIKEVRHVENTSDPGSTTLNLQDKYEYCWKGIYGGRPRLNFVLCIPYMACALIFKLKQLLSTFTNSTCCKVELNRRLTELITLWQQKKNKFVISSALSLFAAQLNMSCKLTEL